MPVHLFVDNEARSGEAISVLRRGPRKGHVRVRIPHGLDSWRTLTLPASRLRCTCCRRPFADGQLTQLHGRVVVVQTLERNHS